MNISQPVASSIGGVSFSFLSSEDIKALSVKKVENADTFDTLLHPTPGGLYDSALGAWGDNTCTTCQLGDYDCPGHPGHIDLPVPVYHPTVMDQLLILLKGKCAYCHHFRLTRAEVNRFVCKFRLLRHGLINDAHELETISVKKTLTGDSSESEDDRDAEEIENDLIEQRNKFVRLRLKRAGIKGSASSWTENKFESLTGERRLVIKEFLKAIGKTTKCATCGGRSPSYRKDKSNKIFRKPLTEKDQKAMIQLGKKVVNPLLAALEAKKEARKEKRFDREADEGIVVDTDSTEEEGDEDEVFELLEIENEVGAGGMLDESAAVSLKQAKADKTSDKQVQEFMNTEVVHATIAALFEKEQEILNLVYNVRAEAKGEVLVSADMFFIRTLLVPPNKYRPEDKTGLDKITEAQQNTLYKKILTSSILLHQIQKELKGLQQPLYRKRDFDDFQNAWVGLQDAVNSLIDSNLNPVRPRGNVQNEEGVKQKLEKKEGLFRKNMMGKRVNFAARSVISPDPNVETNEIGVPPVFAKKLTYPEPVTNHNFYELKEAVLNGVEKWPGAAAIENENGQVINLRNKTQDERQALANQLLAPSSTNVTGAKNKKVHRHLNNGDIVIMNRQPTLHKPSMMAHRARILPGEKTIRMHYVNCNTYNADFDGDEMNLHFPQSEIARAEALTVADTDHQYLVATSGKPLRGLIQDHIAMGVWLTNKDTTFNRGDYQQLLYGCLRPEHNHTTSDRIQTVEPAMIKPRPLWTGKQVITSVLKNIKPETHPGLNLTGKSQTAADRWAEDSEEGRVIFKSGELLCGILDKAHLGPSSGGFVHAIYETYGHTIAGKLLSVLGRLLTKFLHMRAFSCGVEDIVLTELGNQTRREKLKDAENLGLNIASKYVTLDTASDDVTLELKKRLEDVLRDDHKQSNLDKVYNAGTAELSSEVTAACLPTGLLKDFPKNQMQTMTTSGAKGSAVNANLISCNLGQQVLEGRRVPIMTSGKSLPSFKPYETNIRAGGYVVNRFLTGVQPQEYFFHAMAGREGLIDTAVKTSRSGYLQRCLIKGMEGLKVEYDTSVRDSDGSMVQFLYGEDGLDVTKQKHLGDFKFLAENFFSIFAQLNVQQGFAKIFTEEATEWNKNAIRKVKKSGNINAMDPVLAMFNPGSTWGSTSEAFASNLKKYIDENPDKLIKHKELAPEALLTKKNFSTLMEMKYMKSVVDPGEAVGIVAGQSIGEPSTQMTLNTFHLAGHSAKNVTLGIPRLREIVMTASAEISTPSMTMHLNPEIGDEEGKQFAKGITRLTLAEVIDKVTVSERIGTGLGYKQARIYSVRLEFFPSEEYEDFYAIKVADVLRTTETKFIPQLVKRMKKDLKAKNGARSLKTNSSQPEVGKGAKKAEATRKNKAGDGEEGPEDAEAAAAEDRVREEISSDEEDNPDDDATAAKHKNRGKWAYDAPDSDEEAIDQESRAASLEPEDESSGMEDEGYGGSPRPRQKTVNGTQDDDDMRKRAREREERAMEDNRDLTHFSFDDRDGAWCAFSFEFDVNTAKILMLNHVEAACHSAVIQSIPGLGACSLIKEKVRDLVAMKEVEIPVVVTEGVNLIAMRDYQDIINPHKLFANDISAMLALYGVEAARATIVREMDSIFKGHGITVDNRHLNLIADMMTRGGGFTAFSRTGLKSCVSPFMKMSFETTVGFLKDAILDRDWDDLKGPSARIVTGKIGSVGTGAFDVMMPVA